MELKRLCPYCMQELNGRADGCPHCGRVFAGRNPAGSLPAGTVLAGRYTVGDIQSVDGEGILYRGVENIGSFRVTIKEYMPLTLASERRRNMELRPKPGSEVLFKTTRMDFSDLYRSLQRITPATGLEAVLDVFEENNTVYAVMENPGGRPLDKWLEAHGNTVDPEEARIMLQPVFDGVSAMHQVGLVHRGICPENIRVLDNGRARLTGYATVGLRTAGSGLHEQLFEGYSAPEQYSTSEFEGRYTDEYGLAAVFYRMVCGQSPVPAAQRLVADSNPKARTINSAVPEYLSDLLQMGLRLKPSERIQTVPQLFQALSSQEYTQELTRTLRLSEPEPQKTDADQKKHMLSLRNLLAAILILLAVLILLTLWGVLQQGKNSEQPVQPDSEPASSIVAEPVNLTPDFVGLNYDVQIRNDREYVGTYRFYVTQEYSDTVEKGYVIRQSPEAGEIVEKESTISLVISMGPEKVEMPNVIGSTRDDAAQKLTQVGLNASFWPIYNDGSYVPGCVAYCSEEVGTMLDVGTSVVVYIAAEVEATVPVTPEEAPSASNSDSQQEEASSSSSSSGSSSSQEEIEYDTDR